MKSYPRWAKPRVAVSLSLARLLELAVSLVIIFIPGVSAFAQTGATQPQSDPLVPTEGIQKGWNEFGVWSGVAFQAPTLIGYSPQARFGHLGLRYGRVLAANRTLAFEYTIDAIPVAILSTKRLTVIKISPGLFSLRENRESVYGAGLAPVGLKLNFRRHRRVQPFASGTGGFLYFTEQVPVSGASQFNFTFDFGGGVQIVNSNRRSFTIGYKFHHISNGYTAAINRGVDVQMIYAGFSIFR